MGVVVLASLAAGIGMANHAGTGGLLSGTLTALFAWFVWSFITYLIGTRLFPEDKTEADLGQLLRTIGFASAPGLIRIFAIIPGSTRIVFLVSGIWVLVAMIIAVRQALDYESTLRAVGVCFAGWIAQGIIYGIVFAAIKG